MTVGSGMKFAASLVVGTVLSSTAHAQTAVAEASRSDDIVVTAQKRSESAQKVAASITALSGKALTERALTSAEGLSSQVPGLQFAEHANSTLFAIRGIALDILTGAGEPSVAVHVDGVYQPRATTPLIDFSDLERVEVLRGPQGTLYGRNSTGGTINFIPAAPTNDFQGEVTAGLGSFDGRLIRGYVSGPLVADKIKARISASYDENDGPTRNLFNGERLDGRKRTYVHGSLSLTPAETVQVDLGAYYIKEKLSGPVQFEIEQGPFFEILFPNLPVQFTTEPHKVHNEITPRTTRDLLLLTGRLSWNLSDNVTLRSITGYADGKYHSTFDGDGTTLPYITVGTAATGPRLSDSRSFSEEVNLSASLGRLDLIAGLFYFHEHFLPFVPFEFTLGIPGAAPPGTQFYSRADEKTDSYAAFADLTYHLTDRLRVVGGIRASRDKKKYVQSFGFSLPGFPLGTGPGMACVEEPYRARWSSVTPKAGLQFDAAQGVLLYAQYQKGNKAGQFNLTVCGNKVDPENVSSVELGIKSRLLDNRLTLNASAFHYDYKDLQVLRFVTVGGVPTSILDNAATAKVDGLELELVANPSSRVSLNLAVAYLDARYEEYILGPSQDYSGNRLNRAPDWTVKSGAEYRLPLTGFFSQLSLRGEVNYTGRVFYDSSNVRNLSQESTALVNSYLTLTSADAGLTFRAFGRNLTDVDVKSSMFASSAQNNIQGFQGAPRTWGIELSKRF